MSLQLFCFQKRHEEPSPSGYCQKLEAFLRATNYTDYTLTFQLPMTAPKGKLPYITIPDGNNPNNILTIPDSFFIVRHLIENDHVRDPDAGLTASQRADSLAFQGWTENHIYPAVVHTRFMRPENFAVMRSKMLVPWPFKYPVAYYMRYLVSKAMWAQGVGRHSDAEIDIIIRGWTDAIEVRLAESPNGLFYETKEGEPTMLDIVIFGFLANMLGETANPEVTAMILSGKHTRLFIATLTKRWFPEYKDLLEMVESEDGKLS
jgi:hypothetical protein